MKIQLLTLALLGILSAQAQERQEIILQDDWQFSRDKQTWQTVSVPHDWAISGPFDKKWDLQTVAIVQNGEKTRQRRADEVGRCLGLVRAIIKGSSRYLQISVVMPN